MSVYGRRRYGSATYGSRAVKSVLHTAWNALPFSEPQLSSEDEDADDYKQAGREASTGSDLELGSDLNNHEADDYADGDDGEQQDYPNSDALDSTPELSLGSRRRLAPPVSESKDEDDARTGEPPRKRLRRTPTRTAPPPTTTGGGRQLKQTTLFVGLGAAAAAAAAASTPAESPLRRRRQRSRSPSRASQLSPEQRPQPPVPLPGAFTLDSSLSLEEDEEEAVNPDDSWSTPSSSGRTPRNLAQTRLGLGIQQRTRTCKQCQMVYSPSVPEDRLLHQQHHERFCSGPRFPARKAERCVARFGKEDRIVRFEAAAAASAAASPAEGHASPGTKDLALVRDVLELVNRHLGGDPDHIRLQPDEILYVYVAGDRIRGALVLKRLERAWRVMLNSGASAAMEPSSSTSVAGADAGEALADPVLTSNLEAEGPVSTAGDDPSFDTELTSQQQPATLLLDLTKPQQPVFGVDKIWVSESARRKRIAHRLVDAARQSHSYWRVPAPDEIAFSQPTQDGRRFAQAYTGRSDFLAYC